MRIEQAIQGFLPSQYPLILNWCFSVESNGICSLKRWLAQRELIKDSLSAEHALQCIFAIFSICIQNSKTQKHQIK
jgi:hypothetical protein